MITDIDANPALPTNQTRSFPLVFADDIDAIKAFYTHDLGMTLTHDMPHYIQVQLTPAGDEGPELAFMKSPAPPATYSQGFVLSIPVADADALEKKLDAAKIPVHARAEDKPWGWRSVHVMDPAGVVLDFFHTLPAKA